MIETLITIILLPAAIVAGIFTIALGVGLVKVISSKVSRKVESERKF